MLDDSCFNRGRIGTLRKQGVTYSVPIAVSLAGSKKIGARICASAVAQEAVGAVAALVDVHQVVGQETANLSQHGCPNISKVVHIDAHKTHLSLLDVVALHSLLLNKKKPGNR